MRQLPLLLAALLSFGCDSAYVHEHIIDNFVCVYAPWWMFSDGDCQNSETVAKVESVLDNGMVEAAVSCESLTGGGSSRGFSYSARKLADGSTLATGFFFDRGGSASSIMGAGQGTTYCARSEACSGVALASAWRTSQLNGSTAELMRADFEVDAGTLTITYNFINPPSAPSPWVERTVDLATSCTGFNLEAFGVE